MKELWERSSTVDPALQTLAIELPSPGTDIAAELASAIQRSLQMANHLLTCVLTPVYQQNYNLVEARDDAVAAHREARSTAERLRRRIRGLTRLTDVTLKCG